MRYVDLYLNHRNFSLGQQRLLVVHEGPHWVELFSPFNLARGKIPTLAGKQPTLGETWPDTHAKDINDVPFAKIARIARQRYKADRRLVTAAKQFGMQCGVLSAGKHRKPVKRLIEALVAAAAA